MRRRRGLRCRRRSLSSGCESVSSSTILDVFKALNILAGAAGGAGGEDADIGEEEASEAAEVAAKVSAEVLS
jgi:hypothetical protein